MPQANQSRLARAIADSAIDVRQPRDLAPLIDKIGDARVVMLGESTHGTQDFYEWRRLVSEWLIVKHGFDFIAVEGDWPPCHELCRYVTGESGHGPGAREALEAFHRWPSWMWANTEMVRLAEWMRTRNSVAPVSGKVRFYGLDVYSLFESMDAVLERLEEVNPFLARRARARYACFDRFNRDEKAYVRSLIELPEGCEAEVIGVLRDLLSSRVDGAHEAGIFDARQNARVIANAESFYRAMIHGSEDSWNIRDRHMLETLSGLLERHGPRSRGIVWAHNSHIGDYRATDMIQAGQVNLGGLAREKFGANQVALVGFGTYEGEVIASRAWDGAMERFTLPPARKESIESELHRVSVARGCNTLLLVPSGPESALAEVRGHRAIGVVYQPAIERFGNYVPSSLERRYDAFFFVDRSRALEPLVLGFEREEIPETWPAGQ